jgi:hypothetical protein
MSQQADHTPQICSWVVIEGAGSIGIYLLARSGTIGLKWTHFESVATTVMSAEWLYDEPLTCFILKQMHT